MAMDNNKIIKQHETIWLQKFCFHHEYTIISSAVSYTVWHTAVAFYPISQFEMKSSSMHLNADNLFNIKSVLPTDTVDFDT